MLMLKKILSFVFLSFFIVGCGGIADAFQSTEETIDNTIHINKNERSVIHIPNTGMMDPVDLNSTDTLPPAAVEFTIVKYPSHGTLLFTANLAVYKPAVDYSGKDFYSFEIYDTFKDKITTYNITIVINDQGAMPEIVGDPALKTVIRKLYSFTPIVRDKDTPLSSLLFTIKNKPLWASFNNKTGCLSGTPELGDVGIYSDISISVSDDISTVALPSFSISVVDEAQNQPPSIGGTPTTVIDSGEEYSFLPVSSDPENDVLLFSIANKPSWATFDKKTGSLRGNPQSSDVGISASITITVTDSIAVVNLPDFTIEVK